MNSQDTLIPEIDDIPYEGKGILYNALRDFLNSYFRGETKKWPLYWREFADQAAADLIAIKAEFLNHNIKPKF